VGQTLTERERRILADIERHLAADHRLDKQLSSGRLELRGMWNRPALLNMMLAVTSVAALAMTVATAQTGLTALASISAALWAVTAFALARGLALHLLKSPHRR
jgi:hypothetical protein